MHGSCIKFDININNFRIKKNTIDIPTLFIEATDDSALPQELSANMEQYCPKLTRKLVDTGHWALWEAPQQVNDYLTAWLKELEGPSSSL